MRSVAHAAHRDAASMEALLAREEGGAKLVVTDGVFSMHGSIAPLPELRAAATRAGAWLMVETASLPASTCAGITEAFRVMDDEPELRERLWSNTRRFIAALRGGGLEPLSSDTPIVSVVVGTQETLLAVGRELYDAGIRCGAVTYPAVAPDQSLLRLTVNARHTEGELERTAEVLGGLAERYAFLATGERRVA